MTQGCERPGEQNPAQERMLGQTHRRPRSSHAVLRTWKVVTMLKMPFRRETRREQVQASAQRFAGRSLERAEAIRRRLPDKAELFEEARAQTESLLERIEELREQSQPVIDRGIRAARQTTTDAALGIAHVAAPARPQSKAPLVIGTLLLTSAIGILLWRRRASVGARSIRAGDGISAGRAGAGITVSPAWITAKDLIASVVARLGFVANEAADLDVGLVEFEWSSRSGETDVVSRELTAAGVNVSESRSSALGDMSDDRVLEDLRAAGIHLDQEGELHRPDAASAITFVGATSPRRLVNALGGALNTGLVGLVVNATRTPVEIDEHQSVAQGSFILVDANGTQRLRAGTTRALLEALQSLSRDAVARDYADRR
jgi:hypothetical protein